MTYSNINEGLKVGDLRDLCVDTISIDQFNSKIDNTCIVVAFYILYRKPAEDLNKFLQKTAVDIIDTNISPAPTEDGYYVVFVELKRNSKFPQKIVDLINTIKALTNINDWFYRCYNDTTPQEITVENIKSNVDGVATVKENIISFLKKSQIKDAKISNNKITFVNETYSSTYDFVAYGESKSVMDKFNLRNKGIRIDEASSVISNRFRLMLGTDWDINLIESHIILTRNNTDKMVIIKGS